MTESDLVSARLEAEFVGGHGLDGSDRVLLAIGHNVAQRAADGVLDWRGCGWRRRGLGCGCGDQKQRRNQESLLHFSCSPGEGNKNSAPRSMCATRLLSW